MHADLVAYIAGLCLAVSFLPQVVRTFRLKTAVDISMGFLLLSLASAAGYQFYAWHLELFPVLVMNGVFAALVLTEILLKIRYDGWREDEREA